MPRIVTYDTVIVDVITVTQIDGTPAINARYRVRASGSGDGYDGTFVPVLTAQQQTQLTALITAVRAAIATREGI